MRNAGMKTIYVLGLFLSVVMMGCNSTAQTPSQQVDLSGKWSGYESDWGLVVLQDNRGTYDATYGGRPGKLKFHRIGQNTYCGTWAQDAERRGTMSFKVAEDGKEIIGTWTADRDSKLGAEYSAGPILWVRHSNPRVYDVDYSFEMIPDPNTINRTRDLKVWLPVPREWDSQKAVQITSVHPEPHARYVDPEYGNTIFFWDFGKMAEQPACRVDMSFRLESYDVDVQIDPARVGPYDKTTGEYALYTRSTRTIHITPKIRELAREAIGDETNPYRQAKRIVEFVRKKMSYEILDFERGRGIDCLLAYPGTDRETGREFYEGCCSQYTALTVALCRAVGIPARDVSGYIGCNPLIEPNDVKARYSFETKLSPNGLAATQLFGGLDAHMWCEFFIPNYGWIPTDPTFGTMGRLHNRRWIVSKGRDVLLGPGAPPQGGEGYGTQWVALHDGRADTLFYGVENIAKIRKIKVTVLHHYRRGALLKGEQPLE